MQRLLVANRGEIAIRILRTAKEMGIATVAVHSEADAGAMHTRMADRSVAIGPAPSRQSYLRQQAILDAAHATRADAVHPGYGFLSENAAFARRVIDAGLIWVGPPPEAMEAMGDKVRARAHAEAAGVPLAPGSGVLRDADHAVDEAQRIGFPVMMKACAGGGGIGMRMLQDANQVRAQFGPATRQAEEAFGVPDLFLERFVARPRHIEVQVFGDAHGGVVHLYERECSIQRRHQKLVEEAPSPALEQDERQDIGARAATLARRVGYQGAGTMEFLFERDEDGSPRWSFNEMNTRLQVEHPVTEAVTGTDLVEWQLRVARGERLPLAQTDIRLRGHAFEARINAEDPVRGFAPSPGTVTGLRLPAGPGVRVDGCLEPGWTVPDAYDSLVLKLIVHAADRPRGAARMRRALDELEVRGFATNVAWHRALFAHRAFEAGELSTRFLEEHDVLAEAAALERAPHRAAALAYALRHAPGGAARIRMRQRRVAVVRSGGARDWRPA